MDILDSLIQIRRDKKVFQNDLLSHLGVNATTLSKYESRKRKMPFEVMKKYAEYFGYELRLLKK